MKGRFARSITEDELAAAFVDPKPHARTVPKTERGQVLVQVRTADGENICQCTEKQFGPNVLVAAECLA
eukprot:14673432-Alexandrium_andersonii.AAC.1